jgi:hypothetical protein
LPWGAESGIENRLDPRRSGPMRMLAVVCLLSLVGCVGSARVEGFTASGPSSFLYTAQTNTVMTPNDDGTAERMRRDWIADALRRAMCPTGIHDTRTLPRTPKARSATAAKSFMPDAAWHRLRPHRHPSSMRMCGVSGARAPRASIGAAGRPGR